MDKWQLQQIINSLEHTELKIKGVSLKTHMLVLYLSAVRAAAMHNTISKGFFPNLLISTLRNIWIVRAINPMSIVLN